jgi:feruloyl esterase
MAYAAACDSLNQKSFAGATIVAARDVAPPLNVTNKDPFPLGPTTSVTVPFCRVQGVIKPSADSEIKFEVWLPPAATWNGKYEGIGNGGFAGSLIYHSMNWALTGGYAVSGTDTGHEGGSLDSAWAKGHPEKVIDFGWRAVHETALASKAIIEAHYGKAPTHAYFNGCSDGGREALMEAQRFPTDYDGIVAGAPANAWTRLLSNGSSNEQALTASRDAWLPPEILAVVNQAVLAACHGADGVLPDPEHCNFDPTALACKTEGAKACLTPPQLKALQTIYGGSKDGAGKSLFPGYALGGESGPGEWPLWTTGKDPDRVTGTLLHGFASGYFNNMVNDDSGKEYLKETVTQNLADAQRKTAQALDSENPDLSAFRAAGGKLLQYHGWNDSAIPTASSIEYYKAVATKMGGVDKIKEFYRLFLLPGMDHCGGGPGPNAIGGVFGLPPPTRDSTHDVTSALAHWVEDGLAPEQLEAAKYKEDDLAKGVASSGTLSAYGGK